MSTLIVLNAASAVTLIYVLWRWWNACRYYERLMDDAWKAVDEAVGEISLVDEKKGE